MTSFVGLGPMPGTDPRAAAEIILGESFAGLVHLPVLPARGLGADPIGRTGALMADLHLDRGPRSWRTVDRASRLSWTAADYLARDLDACEDVWATGAQQVRLLAVGPWTMAASVERANGALVASDFGAVRYFAQSLAAGIAAQAEQARRRFGATVSLLLSESQLPRVAQGRLAAPSTWMDQDGFLPAQGYREIAEILREVTEPLLAAGISTTLALTSTEGIAAAAIAESGAEAIWLPRASLHTSAQLDFAAALIGQELTLELGIVPVRVADYDEHTGEPQATSARAAAEQAALLWDELGFSRMEIAQRLALAPEAGFSATPVAETVAQLGTGRRAAELLARAAGDLAN